MNYDLLLAPWTSENPPLVPERQFTPWAHAGWKSWNGSAAESQIALFVQQIVDGVVAEASGRPLVVETGTGQGYVTRRIVGRGATVHSFESDSAWRKAMRQLPGVEDGGFTLRNESTPTEGDYRTADFMILDSTNPFRMGEVCLWVAMSKQGAAMFVHDTGSAHPVGSGHYTIATLVRTLKVPGLWLDNPRGGFVAFKGSAVPGWVEDRWRGILELVHDGVEAASL